jgi:predicted MFS family arabinose efflux permease
MTGEASATDASTPDRGDRTATEASTATFESLGIPEYRLLFVAGLISFLAVQAQVVARGWLANELTGDNTGLGGVYMAFGVPLLVATPFGGVLADRLSKRNILITTQLALGASAAWLGFGVLFDFVEYWMLLAVSVIQAVSFAFLGPARISMTTEVVGRRLLTNAIVLGQMSINSTRVFGPALAGIGIGIAWFGVAGVYLASAAFSVVAMLALLPLPGGRSDPTRPRRSVRSEFGEALGYVSREREIGILVVTSFVVVMMGFPYLAFLPRIATELLDVGAAGYGALSAASAVGALAVSVWVAGRGDRRSMWRIQATSGVLFGVAIIGLAAAPGIGAALLVIVAVGGAASGFQGMNNSLALGLADFEYHGRIQSLMMLSFSGFGMASLPLGGLADAVGLRPTLALMGSVIVVAMLVSTAALRSARQRQSTSLA